MQATRTNTDMPDSAVVERLARIEVGMQNMQHLLSPLATLGENIARMQERSERHSGDVAALSQKVDGAEGRIAAVDSEVKKWVNRGFGAYAVAGILLGVIASLIFRTVSDYESAIRSNREAIVTMDRRVTQTEFEMKARAK